MTHSPEDQPPDSIQAARARNHLARTVRAAFKGSGLDIRDRDNHLVISNPGHPDQGRIYITYGRREVSHARTTWTYLGQYPTQDGPADTDQPPADTTAIIRTLTSHGDSGNGDSTDEDDGDGDGEEGRGPL
jgi:hypothetical protein